MVFDLSQMSEEIGLNIKTKEGMSQVFYNIEEWTTMGFLLMRWKMLSWGSHGKMLKVLQWKTDTQMMMRYM